MAKSDNLLLEKAKVNKITVDSTFQITVHCDTHDFVITAEHDRDGKGPVFNVASYELTQPVKAKRNRKPADVYQLEDFRKPTDK